MADAVSTIAQLFANVAERLLGELRELREDLYNAAALSNPNVLAAAYPIEARISFTQAQMQPQAGAQTKAVCKADAHAPVLCIVHASLDATSVPPNPLAFETPVIFLTLQGEGDATPTNASVVHASAGPVAVLVPPGSTLFASMMSSHNLSDVVLAARVVKLQGKKTFRFEK